MDAYAGLETLGSLAQQVALSTTRLAVAFLLLPVFTQETAPALVRNAFFVGLGLITLAIQPPVSVEGWALTQWLGLFLKEALLGLCLGLVMAAVMWAFEAAGQLVDVQAGLAQAQLMDPLSGQQVSLSGALLGRLALWVFMSAGGFTAWIAVLLDSYALWPVARPNVDLPQRAVAIFDARLAEFASLTLVVAGPAMVVLFMVDVALGLANRVAPQLSVQSLSMSLKALAAVLVWLMLLGSLAEVMQARLHGAILAALPRVQQVLPAAPR